MQLVVISGLSGSGKSIALNVLEDSGYYCVDNLPAKLLTSLTNFLAAEGHTRLAVSIDVRSGATLKDLPRYLGGIRARGIDLKLLFLDANTESLVKRFSETRRRHPLSDQGRTVPESITLEREMLADIAQLGHHIDTSELSANTLRSWVKDFLNLSRSGLILLFQSFGFKHGIPLDADFVFDVRCLPNPHYDPQLQPLTGLDEPVIRYLNAEEAVQQMRADIGSFIERWLPCFVRDNRNYLTVAIGCTGGRHRSVYLAESLAAQYDGQQEVLVRHRELGVGIWLGESGKS
jgi:UPF0042 nucleotide-binding protein